MVLQAEIWKSDARDPTYLDTRLLEHTSQHTWHVVGVCEAIADEEDPKSFPELLGIVIGSGDVGPAGGECQEHREKA